VEPGGSIDETAKGEVSSARPGSFANIGGNSEQEHFVEGVIESLTTDLSRIRGAVIIARNTDFTYIGQAARHKNDRA